jgi:hypothetical protein
MYFIPLITFIKNDHQYHKSNFTLIKFSYFHWKQILCAINIFESLK